MHESRDSVAKVVIVTSYPFPDSAATANRVSIFADTIAKECKLNVVVVGPGSNENSCYPIEKLDFTFSVVSVSTAKFKRDKLLLRALGEYNQARNLLKAARNEEADIYIVSLPSVFLLLAVVYIRKKSLVFDFRDIVWGYLIASGGFKSFVGTIIKSIIPFFLRKAEAITVTNSFEQSLLSNLTKKPVKIVSNGISQYRFDRLKRINMRSKGRQYRILYIGNLGFAQHLSTLLVAVGGDDQFKIDLIGSGADKQNLENFAFRNGMKNVEFHGSLEWGDTLDFIQSADCLYGQIGSPFVSAIPSKLYEYLSCQRPIVFGLPDGAAKDFILDFEDVHICSPCDPNELRNRLLQLSSNNTSKSLIKQTNRKKIYRNYIREKQTAELIKIVHLLVKTRI